jgi:hypothetical protein
VIARGAVARVHLQPGAPGAIVVVARPPLRPTLTGILVPGGLSAHLTHDAGQSWPDARGVALLRMTLEGGGGAVLVFERLADALACRTRLAAEGAA